MGKKSRAAPVLGKRKREPVVDINPAIADPSAVADPRNHRRNAVKIRRAPADDSAQPDPPLGKAASRKKRRLDSYVEKKLRQERKVELLAELAETQRRTESTALDLRSTASLGSGRPSTGRERLERMSELDRRKQERRVSAASEQRRGYHSDEDAEDDAAMDDGDDALDRELVDDAQVPARSQPKAPVVLDTSLGSGFARAADGSLPVMIVKSRKQRQRSTWRHMPRGQASAGDEDESSFNSSDSAMDSDEDDEDADDVEDGSSDDEDDADADEDEWGGIPSDNDPAPDPDPPEPRDAPSTNGFKAWAEDKLGLVDRDKTPPLAFDPAIAALLRPKPADDGLAHGPLGEMLEVPTGSLLNGTTGPTKPVHVERKPEIEEARQQLPILAHEDEVMEAIRQHGVVIISGETGSGKTTQVPQFLYEAGFGSAGSDNPGMIGVTQPRRVAAVAMAERVGHELNLPASKVSHQIRYDTTTSAATAIKFMTDGVLLRELAADLLLRKYSVVIVDEAHERSVNTDVLIGVLSRVVRLREDMWRKRSDGGDVRPLRLIIMSATLRVADFAANTSLFATPPPVISVAARQFPVGVHFSRKTAHDYVGEAFSKVSKIHARLPPGGILVFLTGQAEIVGLCRKLEKRYGQRTIDERHRRREAVLGRGKAKAPAVDEADEPVAERAPPRDAVAEAEDAPVDEVDLAADVDDGDAVEDPDALDTDDEEVEDAFDLIDKDESDAPMHILPLYSLLPHDKQMRVFEPVPEGARLIVVATNVAETSLTIPGIKYVVDSGRAKERVFDLATGMTSYRVGWVSKASAAQRAGRAGRVGPGHCYRLYSSAVFESCCEAHTAPEILRMPIEGVVLQMKSMNIDNVVNFPFPTPPDRDSLKRAEDMLVSLGALERGRAVDVPAKVTKLGRAMAEFPLSPRYAKMLVNGDQHGCLPYVIAAVCALSVGEVFVREDAVGRAEDDDEDADDGLAEAAAGTEVVHIRDADLRAKEERKLKRRAFFKVLSVRRLSSSSLIPQTHSALGKGTSDVFRLLSAVGAYEYDGGSVAFCAKNFLQPKAMTEVHKLRAQISSLVASFSGNADAGFVPRLPPPSDIQLKVLRQLITAAFVDRVAVRADLVGTSGGGKSKAASARGVAYRTPGVAEDVFLHPTSVLFHGPPPDFIVFQELHRGVKRVWLKGLTKISPAWLPTLAKPLCTFTVVDQPTATSAGGRLKVSATERECFVRPRYAGPGFEVDLPIQKATQKRQGAHWVFA